MEAEKEMMRVSFSALIRKEGINPYLDPPLGTAGKLGKKGVVPVKVLLDGKPFKANLMPLGVKRTQAKPGHHHRLYLHGIMRKAIGKDVGARVKVLLEFDPEPRVEPMNPGLAKRLRKDPKAKANFGRLSPSHQKEFNRYLNNIKGADALQRNVEKVVKFLRQPGATWFGKQNHKIVPDPNRK